MILTIREVLWGIGLPLIAAGFCAGAAHKRIPYVESEDEKNFTLKLKNQSFHRNFFLNANFVLFLFLVQQFSKDDIDASLPIVLTFFMVFCSWLVSALFRDVPHDIYDDPVMKKRAIWVWISMAGLIALSYYSPYFVGLSRELFK